MHTAEVRIGSEVFSGFNEGAYTRSMEQLASSFRFDYANLGWLVHPGDRCSLLLDDEEVMRGRIDGTDEELTPDSYKLSATARSATGVLVDCSVVSPTPKQWHRTRMSRIAENLCDPFGIEVTVVGDEGPPIHRFKREAGESVYEALSRLVRLRGFWATDAVGGVGAVGGLVLQRAGEETTETTLRLGEGGNVVRAQFNRNWTQRYSDYVFVGQTQASDDVTMATARQLRADQQVVDPAVQAADWKRPLYVNSRGARSREDLGKKAILERNQRAGRSERMVCTVRGWKTDEGNFWQPNTIVPVELPELRVRGRLLLVRATWSFAVEGEKAAFNTQLELTRPEAFSLDDYPAHNRGDIWGS